MALIAPVRLRAVASGLTIEKVRSRAMARLLRQGCAAGFGKVPPGIGIARTRVHATGWRSRSEPAVWEGLKTGII